MEQPKPDGQRYIEKFILYSALDDPDVDIDSYTLSIFGQTGKRLSYTLIIITLADSAAYIACLNRK